MVKAESVDNQEFSAFYMIAILYKKKWLILGVTFIAAIVSAIYALSLPNWYSATANVVPPKNANTGIEGALSGLSSTLKEIGLSKIAGSKGGEQYSFSVILNSRTIADSMIKKYKLREAYEMPKEKYEDVLAEFNSNLSIVNEIEGNYTITITDKDTSRIINMVKDYIYLSNELAKKIYRSETQFNRDYMERRILNIDSNLSIIGAQLSDYSKKTGIISPEDQGKAYVNAVSELKTEVFKQEIAYEMSKAKFGEGDQTTLTQKNVLESLKKKANQAENQPGLVGNFTKSDAAAKGINFLSLYAKYEALTKLRLILMPMLEEARINANREIMTLSYVDEPRKPEKKAKPKRSLIVAGVALGAMFTSILAILAVYGVQSFNKKYKNFIASHE
jgi:capsule polysaccharide export protein KpsE/RkpR